MTVIIYIYNIKVYKNRREWCCEEPHQFVQITKKAVKEGLYLSRKGWRIRKISCSCFALWSIEAAVGMEMGPPKMDFSLQDCWCKVMSLERCPWCSLFWRADVKACYLSLMLDIAEGFSLSALNFSYIPDMSWCDVMLSTATERKNNNNNKRNASPIKKWHSWKKLSKINKGVELSVVTWFESWIWWPNTNTNTKDSRCHSDFSLLTWMDLISLSSPKIKTKQIDSGRCSSIKQSIW